MTVCCHQEALRVCGHMGLWQCDSPLGNDSVMPPGGNGSVMPPRGTDCVATRGQWQCAAISKNFHNVSMTKCVKWHIIITFFLIYLIGRAKLLDYQVFRCFFITYHKLFNDYAIPNRQLVRIMYTYVHWIHLSNTNTLIKSFITHVCLVSGTNKRYQIFLTPWGGG